MSEPKAPNPSKHQSMISDELLKKYKDYNIFIGKVVVSMSVAKPAPVIVLIILKTPKPRSKAISRGPGVVIGCNMS